MSTSTYRIKKVCVWCGKEFEAQKMTTQYCSKQCAERAYKDRKKQEKKISCETLERKNRQKAKIDQVDGKEFLSVAEVAILLGVTTRAIYYLIERGTLAASQLSNRWTIVRRSEVDKMLNARPYEPKNESSTEASDENSHTITEFYTTKEVLEKFSISNSWLFKVSKQQNIPKVTQHGKTYWSKKHCDMIFGKKDTSVDEITEWYSVPEIQEKYGMTLSAIYCLVSKVGIPKKKEGKEVRYSKKHFDAAKGTGEPVESEWYSIAEATEKFNMSRDQLHYYIKTYQVKKKMVGKYCYLAKDEVDALFENIFTPPSI